MALTKQHIIDLAPSVGSSLNPRNSEGSFVSLRDGRILFAYSRYTGGAADDHDYAEIAAVYLSADGREVSQPEILVRPDPVRHGDETEETNCMSVSLLRLGSGDIGLFYLVKHRGVWSEYVMRRSSDEGKTWSEAVLCSPKYKGYYVVNNDRVLMTEKGRLIVPLANHPSVMLYRGMPDSIRGHSYAVFTASDDDGKTWQQICEPTALTGGGKSGTGLQEPGITELAGGTLYAYFRTDTGRQYESVSIDGGASWFAPQPSQFTAPPSPLLIKKNPFSGKYAAVWNPIPLGYGRTQHQAGTGYWHGGRSPLVIAFSDDGVHFSAPAELENNPDAGFCYPAIHFTSERSAFLSYCAGGCEKTDVNCLVRTRIVKLEW